ncbi:MAG: hypothetical protein KDA44_18380, partial [Planctomycetales bacterium]|nr:hypothetical protein [Planctomycetales bacterium]
MISLHGGLLQDLFSDDPALDATIVDWDAELADDDAPGRRQVALRDGRTGAVFVLTWEPTSWADLPGTDVAAALRAAGRAESLPASAPVPGHAALLPQVDLARFASAVQRLLYLDEDGQGRVVWNPDKPWQGADVCAAVAELLDDLGLAPSATAPADVPLPLPHRSQEQDRKST